MGVKRLYKAVTPYPHGAVRGLDFAQNADVMYLVHPEYPVQKVTRYSVTDWRYSAVTFGPIIAPPTAPTITKNKPKTADSFDTTQRYVITFLRGEAPLQESRASPAASVNNDITLQGNTNVLTLPAKPVGVDRIVVYKELGGAYGYIGYSEGSSFTDGSPPIQPVLSEAPPKGDNPFVGAGNYPSAVCFHQQRLVFGRTNNIVNGVWASRSSDFENMDKSRPVKADDALAFAMNTGQVNEVMSMVSMNDLLVFTGDNVFAVAGGDGNVITPGDLNPKPQSSRGASGLKPLAIDNVVFFQPARGSAIRSLGYTYEIEGYKSDDISIFSPHLFKGIGVTSWCYQEEPYSCIWASRDDGLGLCFTWQEEQQVWGWMPMETEGFIEQFVSIPEDGYNRVYALIRRTIAGVERLFVERMALPHGDDLATACHLDCSVTQIYDPPQSYIDQLWHLEGETVSVVYDGNVSHDHVVVNGRVDLPSGADASIISAGLRYYARLETLPPALLTQSGSMQTNRQNIGEVVARTLDTRGINIGASNTILDQVEPMDGGDVTEPFDGTPYDYSVPTGGDWKDECTVIVEQNEPLPCHIVALFYDLKVSRD